MQTGNGDFRSDECGRDEVGNPSFPSKRDLSYSLHFV